MATLKDWVRSNIAWDWMQANGYQTFREHDELVAGVDSGLITEVELYNEDGFNFPRMPDLWKSVEEIQAEEKEKMMKEMAEAGIDSTSAESGGIVVVEGDFAEAAKSFTAKK